VIAEPVPNLMSRPYRGLSVQDVDFELTQAALLAWIIGRDVYRRTEFVLVRGPGAGAGTGTAALVALEPRLSTELFGPVREARVLAAGAELELVDSPGTDVGNATDLARAAGRHRRPGVLAYVVTGRYRHVNFIWDPQPVTVLVDEVVPPHPAKLVDMARQAIAFDEDLPPIDLVQRLISIPQLMRTALGDGCLLPCRGAAEISGASAAAAGRPVDFLDAGPAYHDNWTLVGCGRSEQIYQHFYGRPAQTVSICPEQFGPELLGGSSFRGAGDDQAPRLTKCCLLERGITARENVVVVPWGARLDEVRTALTVLTGGQASSVA
jgi:hypothetical protein